MADHPFSQDPSNTAAFMALDESMPTVAPGQKVRAVVIGGGTGAPVSIRTLLSMGIETSAVVAMADDGGSTGILREQANVTAPGDIRKCLAAFAQDPNDPFTRAFKYRFEFAQNHTLGNLMLSALEDATGSFSEAITICEKLLDARGHVYPSTLDQITLCAQDRTGLTLKGQANACASATALQYVWLASEREPQPCEAALEAIRNADLIVLGPGSLFTSIIPNLLVPGIIEAIQNSRGRTLFVCSLADMQGETRGLSALEHVKALTDHGMYGLLDYVLVHVSDPASFEIARSGGFLVAGGMTPSSPVVAPFKEVTPQGYPQPVVITPESMRSIQDVGPFVIVRNLVDPIHPTWHDPHALRAAFAGVLRLCRSPRK